MKKLFICLLLMLSLCSCGNAPETEVYTVQAEVLAKWQTDFLIGKNNFILVMYEDFSIDTKLVSDKTYQDVQVGDNCIFQETKIKG